MIVSVTPNSGLDYTLYVPSLALSKVNKALQSTISMAGKPADASWVLGEMGVPSLALGFVAGEFGKRMLELLKRKGVETDFIPVGGETRLNIILVSSEGGVQTTITTSTLDVNVEHVAALRRRYTRALDEGATCVVLGGSLPSGMSSSYYTDVVREARLRNVPVVLDAIGANLAAGLDSKPTLIKPNDDELGEFLGRKLENIEEVYAAACELQAHYGTSVVTTMGAKGAVAVLPGRAYFIPPLKVRIMSPGGAGDAVAAGLAAALSRGQSWEEGLRMAFAAAGAVVMTLGTAECYRSDIEQLMPLVELQRL